MKLSTGMPVLTEYEETREHDLTGERYKTGRVKLAKDCTGAEQREIKIDYPHKLHDHAVMLTMPDGQVYAVWKDDLQQLLEVLERA